MSEVPMCWFCNDTGTMSTLVNEKGQPVATTSEGWPPDTDMSKFHWKPEPCKYCGTIKEPWK